MKTILKLCILGWGFNFITAQTIRVEPSAILFPPTYEVNIDSQIVTFYNDDLYPVEIEKVDIFNIYDEFVFFPDMVNFTIYPSDSQKVKIYFKPNQNIFYNSEILFKTKSLHDNLVYGTIRLDVRGQGKFINPYYNSTENLIEEDLKTALKNLIHLGFVSQGYSQRILMFSTFDNWKVNGRGSPNDKVECVYTGRTIENYPMNTDSLINSPWNFNTEHVFPQSFFNQSEPMRSDFFHLFPTDENINNTRGNLPYGWVSNPTGQSNGCKWNSTHFEPRDEFKGTAARALMYFVLKYQDYNNFFAPQENELRAWHFNFPPNSIEKKRCNDIYAYQQNRNPFIDYPQLLKRITKIIGFSSQPISYQWFCDTLIDFGLRPYGQDWYYNFVIINSGNQNLYFNNIHINHPDIQILKGQNDTIITPNEALTIQLKINAQQPVQALLSIYITELAFELKIPVIYHSTTTIANNQPLLNPITIYPNPCNKQFTTEPSVQNIRCWDVVGKEYLLQPINGKWSCEDCKSGIYFLQIHNHYQKLIISE